MSHASIERVHDRRSRCKKIAPIACRYRVLCDGTVIARLEQEVVGRVFVLVAAS